MLALVLSHRCEMIYNMMYFITQGLLAQAEDVGQARGGAVLDILKQRGSRQEPFSGSIPTACLNVICWYRSWECE